ncbi:MAG: SPASM domain-containing protein [Treponema sp.]|nr:SPASM domain-containing protein [Treponema sp.]
MKHIYVLIKPASSLCNMRCSYCFYSDVSARRDCASFGIMDGETRRRIIGNIFACLEDGDEITFAFQGGEPTLAGTAWFVDFAELVSCRLLERNVSVHYAFQTNGLLLDDAWCRFFRDHNVLVGLSLDGSPGAHDRNRVDAAGRGTSQRVLKGKQLLDTYRVEYNILCVLSSDIARDPDRMWRFIIRETIEYIQFIPCLPRLDKSGAAAAHSTLRPAMFASFYSLLFRSWARELEGGHYVSVKFFDDMINLFFRGIISACGITGQCGTQYVVEADGSVYPCDFYACDEYCTGNLTEKTPRELFDSEKMQLFLREKPPVSRLCDTCPYYRACGGGCKRMRNVMYSGVPEICGLKIFLDKCLLPLGDIAGRFMAGKI